MDYSREEPFLFSIVIILGIKTGRAGFHISWKANPLQDHSDYI